MKKWPEWNQVGYLPTERKRFNVQGSEERFEIVEAKTGTVVWRGTTSPGLTDKASGEQAAKGDFSDLREPGTYLIHTARFEDAELTIADDCYHELHQALLRAFYYLRCGMELTEPFAGPWTHGACHRRQALIYGTDEYREVNGGWHDAGDYGKYTVAAAVAVADLLLAYEFNPAAFVRPLPLPETGSVQGMPDVLHECRYELEFLLKMQASDGGAFHKVTTYNFCGLDVMPEDDRLPLVLSPVSSTATGDLAAILALAARIYEPWDADFTSRCLDAAESAWSWMLRHPEGVPFHNPPEIKTGEYGDKCDRDERFWAAAELFRTTGKEDYHDALKQAVEGGGFDRCELGWVEVGGYGTIAYLFTDRLKTDAHLRSKLREEWLKRARRYQETAERDGYGVALEPDEYKWGSNMTILNHAQLLLIASIEASDALYRQTALEQLHYLLGRNVLGQSYVTGFGKNPIRHPHYRPGVGDGIEEAVPGMVSGGANPGLHDDYAREHLTGRPPAASFVDHELCYSCNEITIYWNSPAVFVTSFFVSFA
ncbi:glycoside hydrolase family 9 protein [Gorillibacterium timonense]|uniref:glycoside hydrolase family 9 protein n=1 Tax=Gorillibacterium timonense TaxID=1689269 RepID=UPI00071C6492|nr:glycoside hydrolase family 9 protein [Gorillibacterium timonense]